MSPDAALPMTTAAAFLAGLLGSAHCLGMCGGIVSALAMRTPEPRGLGAALGQSLLYNFGRIASYTLAGALAGGLAAALGTRFFTSAWTLGLRAATGVILIALGLQIAFRWQLLRRVEALGAHLWRRISPLAARLLKVRGPLAPLALGALWGWLPCGLVYSLLLAAAVSGSATSGALVMASFGAGTLPAMVATGAAAGRLLAWSREPAFRIAAGLMLTAFGVWTAASPFLFTHGSHDGSHGPTHSAVIHPTHSPIRPLIHPGGNHDG